MTTMPVKDANGVSVDVEKPLAPGRAAASASRPIAFCNEDFAVLDGLETKLDTLHTDIAAEQVLVGAVAESAPGTDIASSGLNGRLQRIAQRLTTLITALGTQVFGAGTATGAQRVTLASDDPAVATLGATNGAAVITDADGTIQRYLRGIVKLLITSGTIVLGAGTAAIGKLAANSGVDIGDVDVTSLPPAGYTATATFTPSAAAYLANDIMDVAKTFSWVDKNGTAFPGGDLLITTVELMISENALQTGETFYILKKYNVTPPSARSDNAAWDLVSGDRASYQGGTGLGVPADEGSTLYVKSINVNEQITVANTGNTFAELVTVGALTATATARKVTLHAVAVIY